MSIFTDAKTLTGITLEEAYKTLNENLGKDAYVKLEHGAKLTSIKAAYQWDLMTRVFGPLGIGWHYTIDEYEVLSGSATAKVSLSYVYSLQHESTDGVHTELSTSIQALGGHKNQKVEDQLKGAVTDALGKAMSMLGMQRFVYMDEKAPDSPLEPLEGNMTTDIALDLIREQATKMGKGAAREFHDHCIAQTEHSPKELEPDELISTFNDWRKARDSES